MQSFEVGEAVKYAGKIETIDRFCSCLACRRNPFGMVYLKGGMCVYIKELKKINYQMEFDFMGNTNA